MSENRADRRNGPTRIANEKTTPKLLVALIVAPLPHAQRAGVAAGPPIYFRSNRGRTKGSIQRIRKSGGEIEEVSLGACLDFTPDGAVTLLARNNRRVISRMAGKDLALATVAAPHAFAPARLGVFFLKPLGIDRAVLEYAALDGAKRAALLTVVDPGRDLTVDAGAKLLRWSQAEQAESDLMMTRIE